MRSKIFLSILVVIISINSCKKDDNNKDPDNATNVTLDSIMIQSDAINKIIIDNGGIKWFATDSGLLSYDGLQWTIYIDEPHLNTKSITDIAYERTSYGDELWFASNQGITVASYNVDAISTATTYNVDNTTLLSNTISAVGVGDSSKRYFGTPQGLSIFKGSKWGSFIGREGEEILRDYKISSIAPAKDGWVYAATNGGGVSCFKYYTNDTVDAISGATTYNQPWADGLKSDNVNTVIIVDSIYQWYGTDKGASFHTSEKTKADWTHYNTNDGLICDTVYAIAKDLEGNVWFGTHRGISKFNNPNWTSYTEANGLINNKINTIAVDIDGSIWVGTDVGISHYIENTWKNYIKK
jgi:ligand-binding sensor domain-containing protein